MEDTSTEKKLQLVHQIRSQYHKNQFDMSNRERILYGSSYTFDTTPINTAMDIENNTTYSSQSLKFRSAVAIMLLLFSILFDTLHIKPAGIEMKEIFNMIESDYLKNIQDKKDFQ